jgi:hypothetical protein
VKGEVYDLLVRAEDAGKINRVIEKFHLIEVDGGAVPMDPKQVEENRVVDARTLLSKMLDRGDQTVNPQMASEEPSLSDASFRTPNQANRPSVVKELNGYVREASEKRAEQGYQAMPNIMPNLMGDELSEEERRKQSEAAELLGDMLGEEKKPVQEA